MLEARYLLDDVIEDVVVDGLDDRVTRRAALLRAELHLGRVST